MNIEYPKTAQYDGLKALWMEAFGDSADFVRLFFETGFSPDRCRCVAIDGKIAAALYWFDCALGEKKLAYLYAVATARAYRGRGLCAALVADTHALLRKHGFRAVVLVPGAPGLFEMYGKMGYRPLACMDRLECEAKGYTPVHLADPAEYAAVRRTLLPPGGVVQEGENLSYLCAIAELYTGNGVALAAVREGETLRASEFLGDPAAAPGILTCLGLKKGTFRIPGKSPFAMYYPLAENSAPAYFGLAFD